MNLNIISPTRFLSYEVAWLEFNTRNGSFVIQKGHSPAVFLLLPHAEIIFRLKNGKQESLVPASGIIEVTREIATVIIQEI